MVFLGPGCRLGHQEPSPLRAPLAAGAGGLALAAALAFVFDVPEIAWPVLAATRRAGDVERGPTAAASKPRAPP